MKMLKIAVATMLSLATLNASAHFFPHAAPSFRGHNYGYHGGRYPVGYGRGYSHFGYLPWVVGGAFLFGAIELSQSQTVYVEQGVTYTRQDTYCVDQYGQQQICGYDWVQQ